MSGQRYLVTARKYRPQTFGDLVAQEHVSETLKNAIRLDRLAHAYLFSGPRGVGKTTAARILAKAINCTAPPDQRVDAAEPCRACDSCRSFEEGRNLSIIEIDAASNNKVEDIRELRDTVRIPPQGSRKKVYIVDEVHMLSNAAFNALLKTLEEPPPYVLFIFATTEPHKVLPTILSRCQRFDFRRIAAPEIVSRLELICAEESITADEASLLLIARKGDGALRDALSVFDQAVSLCGTALEYAELGRALGVVDVDLYFDSTRCVVERDSAGMLRLVERLIRAGYDLQEFLGGLAEHLRNLLVASTTGEAALIEATEATRQRYMEEARRIAESDLLRLLMISAETEEAIKNSTQPRLKLETGLLKMVGLARSADLRQALEKLERLETLAREGKLGSADTGAPSAESSSSHSRVGAPPAPSNRVAEPEIGMRGTGVRDEGPRSEPNTVTPRTPAIHQLSRPAAAQTAASALHKEDLPRRDAPDNDESAPEPLAPPPPRPSLASTPFGAPALSLAKPSRDHRAGPHHEPAAMFAGSSALAVAPASAPSQERLFEAVTAAWPEFIQHVRARQVRLGAMLAHATPDSITGITLIAALPDPFFKEQLDAEQPLLLQCINAMLDDPIAGFQFIIRRDPPSEAAADSGPDADPARYMQQRQQEDPVVRAIFEQFGGEIVW